MSAIFYVYPIYKSYQCVSTVTESDTEEVDVRLIKHWLSFWLFSSMLDQFTLIPLWMKLPFVVLSYFPDVTEWNRLFLSTLIPKLFIMIDTYRKNLITNEQIMTSTNGLLTKTKSVFSNILSNIFATKTD